MKNENNNNKQKVATIIIMSCFAAKHKQKGYLESKIKQEAAGVQSEIILRTVNPERT